MCKCWWIAIQWIIIAHLNFCQKPVLRYLVQEIGMTPCMLLQPWTVQWSAQREPWKRRSSWSRQERFWVRRGQGTDIAASFSWWEGRERTNKNKGRRPSSSDTIGLGLVPSTAWLPQVLLTANVPTYMRFPDTNTGTNLRKNLNSHN